MWRCSPRPSSSRRIDQIGGLMSLLEGHGDITMDRAGADAHPDAARFSRVLQRATPASAAPSQAAPARSIGLDAKLRQYEQGERFIEAVEATAGPSCSTGCGRARRCFPPWTRSAIPRRGWRASGPAPASPGRLMAPPRGGPCRSSLRPADCRFPAAAAVASRPGPVVCAVSGGADSLALLALAVAAGCVPTAVHVDHGLRPGSAPRRVVVAGRRGSCGAGFRAVAVEVGAGPNLEARARAGRTRAPRPEPCGHTADDQAETLLLNLLRGAGSTGWPACGAGAGRRRTPILGLRRAETGPCAGPRP